MGMGRSGLIERGVFAAALAVTLALAMTAAATLAPAAQLDDKTCVQLKLEIGQLEGLGARDNFAKGAAWGKANLRSNQLEQVKKLIEMDETVQFRCPRPKPIVQAADPATVAKGKAPGKVIAKVLPKVEPGKSGPAVDAPPRPKAKTKAAPQVGDAAQTPPVQKAQPPAKPRPRPKVPDAAPAPADPAQ
jgi:hypothetical protein